jgi:hypothetical protein
MSYLSYLSLFTYSGVQHISCCVFLCIVNLILPVSLYIRTRLTQFYTYSYKYIKVLPNICNIYEKIITKISYHNGRDHMVVGFTTTCAISAYHD